MRVFGVAAALCVLSGCGSAAFQCINDLECQGGDLPGTCEPVGYCSFPDTGCPSGQRYAEFSNAFGDMCVPADGGSASGSGGMSESGSSSSTSTSTGMVNDEGTDSTQPTVTTIEPTTGLFTTGPDGTGDESSAGRDSTGGAIESDLALWLDFEAGDADKSDYNHGVSCEMTCPSGTVGPFGSAALFGDDYLEIAAHPVLDFSQQLTLTAWVRVDGMNPLLRATILAQEYTPGSISYDVSVQDLDGDAVYDLVIAGEGQGAAVTDRFVVGEWVFLAIRSDAGQQEVFLDGEQVYAGGITQPSSQQAPVYVGGLPTIGFSFEGGIDDLRLYRRLLGDTDLEMVMAGVPVE